MPCARFVALRPVTAEVRKANIPMRKMALSALLVICLAPALAACGDGTAPIPQPTQATTEPTSSATINEQPTPDDFTSSDITIRMETSGGIAGIDRVLDIDSHGLARLTDKGKDVGTMQLTPDRFRGLVNSFKQARIFELQGRYDKGNIADDIYDTITFHKDRDKTVTVAQVGSEGLAPKELLNTISMLKGVEDEVDANAATPTPGTIRPSTPRSLGERGSS